MANFVGALKRDNFLAFQWLRICSYLYPEDIPEMWILDWLSESIQDPQEVKVKQKKILSSLQDYGIIRYKRNTKTFSIHRSFQHMVRDSRKDYLKEDLNQVIGLIEKHAHDYRYLKPWTWDSAKLWYPHAAEVRKWLRQYPADFSEEIHRVKKASIAEGIGLWCLYHSRFRESIESFQEALELVKSLPKQTQLHRVITLCIGWDLYKLGRYKEGLFMCSKAEEIWRQFHQDKLLDYTYILNARGSILFELGEYDEALKCHQEALKIRQELIKKEEEIYILFVAQSLYNVALCLHQKGDHKEATQLLDQSLFIQQKKYKKTQPLIVLTLVSKVEILVDQGQYTQALKLLKETLFNYQSLTDIYPAELTHIWNGMGKCYLHFNRLREAKKTFKKALTQGLIYYGNQAPSTLTSYQGLGWSYLKSMHIKKGLKYLIKELETGAQLYQDGTKPLVVILEKFKKAAEYAFEKEGETIHLEHALNIARNISTERLGKDHPLTKSLILINEH